LQIEEEEEEYITRCISALVGLLCEIVILVHGNEKDKIKINFGTPHL